MAHGHDPSRRQLLRFGAASAATGLLWTPGARSAAPIVTAHSNNQTARNVIFMIADGMSAGVPALAEAFSMLVRDRGLHWSELARDRNTVQAWQETASLDSLVTDSAAASTAWATGSRCFNGAICMLPDGRELTPIGPLVRATGRRVGLVTTTRITHATPAGFAASVPRRDLEDDIAVQYLGRVDVLLGGGGRHFAAEHRRDNRDLAGEFSAAEYTVLQDREALRAAGDSQRILGLFTDSHLPYSIDRAADVQLRSRVPTLAEMTEVALHSLAAHDGGFLLQVEGGRVDHAAHNNDAPGLLWDQLAFDDAIGVALAFVEAHPDTLLIITTDHGNGNPGLNGMGSRYAESTMCFKRLARATASYEAMAGQFNAARRASDVGGRIAVDAVRAITKHGTGLDLADHELEQLLAALNGEATCELFNQHAGAFGLLGQATGNQTGIGWTGITHTSDLVMLMATGAGREHFAGMLHATDVYDRLVDLMGITHRNPNMTPGEAAKFLRRGPGLRPAAR